MTVQLPLTIAAPPTLGSALDSQFIRLLAPDIICHAVAASDELEAWVHPLGFVHVRLGEVAGVRRRLHVWRESAMVSDLGRNRRIHNHAFTFTSLILAGRVAHRPYLVEPALDGEHRLFEVTNGNGGASMRATDRRCRIVPGLVQEFGVGENYYVDADMFHDVISVDSFSATLLAAAPQKHVQSLIVSEGASVTPWKTVGGSIERSELRELLKQLQSLLPSLG